MHSITKALLSRPEISALVMLILVIVGFSLYAPQFMTYANIRVTFFAFPELGIVVLGVGILMIAGEFDLSVGSVFALSPLVMVIAVGRWGFDPIVAIAIGFVVALFVGYLNGWITLQFSIPSFVTTLGMLFMARSAAVVLSGGFPPPFPADFPTGDLRRRSRPVPRLDDLVRGLRRGPRRDAPLLEPRQLDLRHRRPAARRPPTWAINTRRVKLFCFMLCSLPRGLRRHDHDLPAHVGAAGARRGRRAAGDRRGRDRRHGAHAAASARSIGFIVGTGLIRVIDNGLVMARIDANWFRFAIGALTILAVILNMWVRRRARAMH